MPGPDRVDDAESPRDELEETWRRILERDYTPAFRSALAVLKGGSGAVLAVEATVGEFREPAGRLPQSHGGSR